MTNFLIEIALVLALLLSLGLHWRTPKIVTEYRDREVPAPPPVQPVVPEPTVKVRFLGDFGHVCGEITIPVKARRPVLHHGGTAYTAERYTNGLWLYRRIYG